MSIYVKSTRINYNLTGDLQHTQTWTNLRGQGVCDPDAGKVSASRVCYCDCRVSTPRGCAAGHHQARGQVSAHLAHPRHARGPEGVLRTKVTGHCGRHQNRSRSYRSARSRSVEIVGHDRPESPVTIDRNLRSRSPEYAMTSMYVFGCRLEQ